MTREKLVSDVHAHVKRETIVDLTQRMVRINSEYEDPITLNHQEMADFLAREIEAMGYEVETVRQYPDFPVVVGRLRGTVGKPVLGFCVHYGTVLIGDRSLWSVDPLGGVEKEGRIWGRGATNSKGGLACQLAAARAIKESGVTLKGDLVLLFFPGEGGAEFCLPWIAHNRPELIRANWYLESGSGGNIVKMAGGHVWLEVVVRGTMGHPGNPGGINAIQKMIKLLPTVLKVEDWMTWEPDPLFEGLPGVGRKQPYGVCTKIVGGDEINVMPARCVAQLDFRLFPKQIPETVVAELKALVERLKKEDPELHVEVEQTAGANVPYEEWAKLTEDDPLIKTIFEVAPSYTGKTPEWRGSRGGGRGYLWKIGCKWVPFGIKQGGGAHDVDEWVDIESQVQHTRIFAELAVRMLT